MPESMNSPDRLRVLMLTHRVPYPPDRGDRIRAYHLLRQLAGRYQVHLASVSDEPVTAEQRAALDALLGREQVMLRRLSPMMGRVRGAWALLGGDAATPAVFYRHSFARHLIRCHQQQPFDVILTFCTGMAHYARALLAASSSGAAMQRPRPAHLLDMVDVDSLKWREYAARSRGIMHHVYTREATQLAKLERCETIPTDAVTLISEAECRAYREQVLHEDSAPAQIASVKSSGPVMLHAVSNGVDLQRLLPLPDAGEQTPPTLSFIGILNYQPNVEAMHWFTRHVLPPLRAMVPEVTLRIAGRHPARSILALSRQAGVQVVGPVTDVQAELARAHAAVAPLQLARGVQNKVLEAMAGARVAICSPQAAQGIDATPGEHLLVAASPREYAAQIADVLLNASRRRQLAQQARQRMEERYDWAVTLEPMVQLVARIAGCPDMDAAKKKRLAA